MQHISPSHPFSLPGSLFGPVNDSLVLQGEMLAEACCQSLTARKFYTVIYVYDVIGTLNAINADYQ